MNYSNNNYCTKVFSRYLQGYNVYIYNILVFITTKFNQNVFIESFFKNIMYT